MENKPVNRVSRAIIYDDQGRVLLGKRVRNGGVGKFALIGGKPDNDETAAEAIIREVKEEVNLDFDPTPFDEMEDKLPEEPEAWLVSFFTGPARGTVKFDPEEVAEVVWVSENDLDQTDITFNHRDILKRFFAQRSR